MLHSQSVMLRGRKGDQKAVTARMIDLSLDLTVKIARNLNVRKVVFFFLPCLLLSKEIVVNDC